MIRNTSNTLGIIFIVAPLESVAMLAGYNGKNHEEKSAASSAITLSRDQFTRLVHNKKQQEKIATAGRPEDATEGFGKSSWSHYHRTYDPVTGKVDYVARMFFGDGINATSVDYFQETAMSEILTLAVWVAIFFVVALPFICASMCIRIAGQDGRDKLSWKPLGFFFGIFALIALAILPKNEENLLRAQQ